MKNYLFSCFVNYFFGLPHFFKIINTGEIRHSQIFDPISENCLLPLPIIFV